MSHDASDRVSVASALWSKGTVFLEKGLLNRALETPSGSTTYFGIGQSILFIPFDALGALFVKLWGTEATKGFISSLPILFLYAPLVGVFWWRALVLILTRRGISQIAAETLGIFFFLSTLALPYSAQSLQEEPLIGALLAMLLALFFSPNFSRGRLEGFLLGSVFLFRLNAIFAVLPLIALWWERTPAEYRRERAARTIQGALIPILLFALFNYWRFGSPFSTGYDLAYAQLAEKGVTTWKALRPQVAIQLLIGSGKGFFFLSPVLLIALLGFGRLLKEHRLYAALLLVSLLGSALVHSKLWGYSCGGISWGPRFQVHFLSHFILPFAWGTEALWKKGQVTGKILVTVLIAVGFFLQGVACLLPDSLEYHQEMLHRGDYKEELVTSLPYGQLSLRISNVFRTIQNRPLFLEKRAPTLLSGYRKGYFPNFWGHHYSKVLGPWVSGLWKMALCLSFALIFSPLLGLLFFRSTGHLRPLWLQQDGCSPM
jgi:hypothetical protein